MSTPSACYCGVSSFLFVCFPSFFVLIVFSRADTYAPCGLKKKKNTAAEC